MSEMLPPCSSPEFAALVARPSAATFGALVAYNFRRHPIRNTSFLATYCIGLGAALFFAGFAVSPERLRAFEAARPSGAESEMLFAAQNKAASALQIYRSAQGWFGWCSDGLCLSAKARYEDEARRVAQLQAQYDAQMRAAKKNLGVFSEYGVAEVRELFASLYGWGKGMVNRMSYYDLLFSGFRMRRDDGIFEWAVQMLGRILQNMVISTVAVVFSFATSVGSVIASFSPSWPEAIAFYLLAMAAVLATVLTACLGCCGCLVGAPIAVAMAMPPGAFNVQRRRIDAGGNLGGQRRQQPQPLHAHYQ
jgi:hypothetical protein